LRFTVFCFSWVYVKLPNPSAPNAAAWNGGTLCIQTTRRDGSPKRKREKTSDSSIVSAGLYFRFGSIHVDVRRSEVTRDGMQIYLTARELQLLCYLVERTGSTVPRTELLRSLWGYEAGAFTRTVDTHVSSLRQKLEGNPGRPELILTVPGVGYKFMGSSQK